MFCSVLLFSSYRFGRRATSILVFLVTGTATVIVGIVQYIGKIIILILFLLIPAIPYLCKQCSSRSVGFRSLLFSM